MASAPQISGTILNVEKGLGGMGVGAIAPKLPNGSNVNVRKNRKASRKAPRKASRKASRKACRKNMRKSLKNRKASRKD